MAGNATPTQKLYYVYALADRGLPRRFVEHGRTLQTVDFDDVSVIVEVVGERRGATEEALRDQHALVMRLADRFEALLPVRFGAHFTRSELQTRMTSARDVIRDTLDRVRGRVQMTVRVVAPAVQSAQAGRLSSGTAYLAARSERERAVRRNTAKIGQAVSRFVVDQRVEPGKGDLQATVYHLIHARDVEPYRTALELLTASLAPARLTVTGPWPVFAFVPELDRA